ncbi:hypothetical protein I6H96_21340 [Brucella anthropi]|uniref:Phage transcriptional regulator, AlpA n=1 Tax=Brucella anthropi (strain ATCC 49188 / DSM 6882 / CCUG 24695 / JCM 21032 / LMG 3331 / NBRC 15819 / NCTC 12168 / Alc 37) TaxID=439375 RepID=A6X586_BRUA4|nr:phage transcriptional regulator AlpA [Brucella anthropi]ABS16390.1 phage transcriptional regulator, AlpA [Brucella anthropi ATCC 49188]NKC49082.1 Rha family transcriptional regulator [Brucella anthropi ATCC 49188]QQC27276.1 hypothetical protein I6H96_21340 [Brucella anthropi]SUB43722.1 Predicted transcriptional regulator [Brucella anthropi]
MNNANQEVLTNEPKKTLTEDRLLDKAEARARLGRISEATFYRLQQSGQLKKPLKLGNRSFWRESWLESFVAGREASQ